MNFYNTVHILQIGSHLFQSCKNTRVKAVSQPALQITYKAALTHNARILLLCQASPLAMCPGNQCATSLPPKSNAVRNIPTLQRAEHSFMITVQVNATRMRSYLLMRGTKLSELAKEHRGGAIVTCVQQCLYTD